MDFVLDIKSSIGLEAENLVNKVFPEKTAQLDAILQSPEFRLENIPSVREKSWESHANVTAKKENSKASTSDRNIGEPPAKLLKSCDEGDASEDAVEKQEVFSNPQIVHLLEIIRPEIITLMESCNTIRTWVMLLLPKMEDGNNFGVSVQEETMGELKGVETETAVFLESTTSYFFARAKVASKVIKHPKIHDYARFIAEEDEKQFVSLRHTVAELRNFYSSLHDLIMKNIDKIKKPRNSNLSSMY
uniref:proteasome activator complex subunit 3-like n=1 Tax=Styela clava TaxID=7725 RepID=UPI001939EEC0|nr:proteasome activator complex subunit 3-like [Styela clava]